MHYLKFLVLGLLLAIAFSACTGYFSKGRPGSEIEKWETTNSVFRIRVTSFEEVGGFPSGAYYAFDSAPVAANDWRRIMTFRHDDRPKIQTGQIRFVDSQTAYAFMGWMYAVTTDGGTSWSVWDARKDLANWQCCNYELIRDASIHPDGTGTMVLNPIPERSGEVPELQTLDFGRHWSVIVTK